MEQSTKNDELLQSIAQRVIALETEHAEPVSADTETPNDLFILLTKVYREETGLDLKQSADAVREYLLRHPHPEYNAWADRRCELIWALREGSRRSGRKPWWRFWDGKEP